MRLELDTSELAKDAAETSIPSDDKLRTVSILATKQVLLEAKVEQLEAQLKEAKAELEACATKELPEAMLDTGLRKFTTESGLEIKLEHQYFPGVNKEDEPAFHQWLIDNNKDGIVNVNITIPLGKGTGNLSAAKTLIATLQHYTNQPIELKGDIHWQTFRAFARELVESQETPPEYLKIHQVDRAKIKLVR